MSEDATRTDFDSSVVDLDRLSKPITIEQAVTLFAMITTALAKVSTAVVMLNGGKNIEARAELEEVAQLTDTMRSRITGLIMKGGDDVG